jgi:hypothetical protein
MSFGQDGALLRTTNAALNVQKVDSNETVLSTRLPERFGHTGSPCHHPLQMPTNLIRCYGAFWNIHFTKTLHTQSRNWNKNSRQQWSALAAAVRNFRRWLQMVIDDDGVLQIVFTWLWISQNYWTQRNVIQQCLPCTKIIIYNLNLSVCLKRPCTNIYTYSVPGGREVTVSVTLRGRALAQAISCRLPTAATQVRGRVR